MPKQSSPKAASVDHIGIAGKPYHPARWDPANPSQMPITETLVSEAFAGIAKDPDVKEILKAIGALDVKWLKAGEKISELGHNEAIATFRLKLAEAVAAADGRKLDTKADYLKFAKQARHPLKQAQVDVAVEAAEVAKPLYRKLISAFAQLAQARAEEELKYADANDDSPSAKLKALSYAPIYLEHQFKKLGEPRNVRPRSLLLGIQL